MASIAERHVAEQVEPNNFNDLITKSIDAKLAKLKVEQLILLANKLNIELTKIKKNKKIKKIKKELLNDIANSFTTITIQEKIDLFRKTKIGLELEIKNILEKNINITDLIKSNVCLTLDKFFETNPKLKQLFNNTCDLENINNTIKSKNCAKTEAQGLYILTIGKDNIDYIVKLGSFAESQGMYKRLTSFGGGNYETGSLTNKWFQKFIKLVLEQGYTSKFTYYNKIQEKIKVENLDGGETEIIPYVIRPLETELFEKYISANSNIPPIFGSNCL